MYVCIYIYINVCMYIYIDVCIYIYIYMTKLISCSTGPPDEILANCSFFLIYYFLLFEKKKK